MTDRIALSKRTRFEVFKRDGFRCQYCGRHPPEVTLEIDHVIPVCDGGDAAEANLLTSCFDCNRGKAGVSLSIASKTLEQKGIEIAEREEQLRAYREIVESQRARIEQDLFEIAAVLYPEGKGQEIYRRWVPSIKRFLSLLPLDDVLEAAEIAVAQTFFSEQRRFRYFCGICWRKIKGPEEGEEA